MKELLNNQTFVWGAMSIVVLILSQLLKLPIKALTEKTIKDKNVRDRVNVTIMLIPLALGILVDYFFCTYYLKLAFDIIEGVKIGGTAITLYGVLEKLFKGKVSEETQGTLELTKDIVKDGKLNAKDGEIVKDFINKVK
jgi:hypothetical protein